MLALLWLVPALPLAGFVLLTLGGRALARRAIAWCGGGSVALSMFLALALAVRFISAPPAGHVYRQLLWSWMRADTLQASISLYLDPLALVMMLVVTVVGFLIHLYSVDFIEGQGYARFFAGMNLFVGSMLLLVLAGDLLLLYLGWEGVGLCSYLLIRFWYGDPANADAARKAFIVTRIGDAALAVGLFVLFTQLRTFEIQELLGRAAAAWPVGATSALLAAALVLGGAVGKSAQLPLQTWLPDAMAGPSPVSALIHAATMVTAGVYLIARLHGLFVLAPVVQWIVALIGAATLVLAGCSALAQRDIKRVLAYSTMSQLGYMFLALGVGAWPAAIFHLVTHAFCKALLFLGAGAVLYSLHHEHDLFRMGGLRRQLPLVFWTMLIGGASLAGIPLITAGFYSKDMILWGVWAAGERSSPTLWSAGIVGSLLTGLYISRPLLLAFFGEERQHITRRPTARMHLVLVAFAALAVLSGFVELPPLLGNLPLLSRLLSPVLPPGPASEAGASALELILLLAAAVASLLGLALAYALYLRRPAWRQGTPRAGWSGAVQRLWAAGWGFDWLYGWLVVRPFLWLARSSRDDPVDQIYAATAWLTQHAHYGLRATQNGRLRWYVASIALGAVVVILVVLLRSGGG